jgi:hypothetical protein
MLVHHRRAKKIQHMALKTQHRYQLFLFSGVASCTAELCTVPIVRVAYDVLGASMALSGHALAAPPLQDVVKIRMQLQGELGAKRVYSSSLGAFPHIVREEGLFALWKGGFGGPPSTQNHLKPQQP